MVKGFLNRTYLGSFVDPDPQRSDTWIHYCFGSIYKRKLVKNLKLVLLQKCLLNFVEFIKYATGSDCGLVLKSLNPIRNKFFRIHKKSI